MNKFIENSLKDSFKDKTTALVFISLFVLILISRWGAHLWNFTLVGGAFLFAGSFFQQKKVSLVLLLMAMLVSDYVIGFHNQMLSVYFAYFIVLALGFLLQSSGEKTEIKEYPNRIKILSFAVLGSFSFYVITNFFVWFEGLLYPRTLAGLIECYVMGIPFYKNQILSDVLSAFAFFEVGRVLSQIGLSPVVAKAKTKNK